MSVRSFDDRFKELIDEELSSLRSSILTDVEKTIVYLLRKLYTRETRYIDPDLSVEISKTLDDIGEISSTKHVSFRKMLQSVLPDGESFESEVDQAFKDVGITSPPTFRYRLKLLGEAEKVYEDAFESFTEELYEAAQKYEEEYYEKLSEGFFDTHAGQAYLDNFDGDLQNAYEDYLMSDEYAEFMNDEISNLSLRDFTKRGFDSIVMHDTTEFEDSDAFEEDTILRILSTVRRSYDNQLNVVSISLDNFEFEIGLRVGLDLYSLDTTFEQVKVLNFVARYLTSVKSEFDDSFHYETTQLNLFTGDVDLVDIGRSVRISPNIQVSLCEIFNIAQNNNLKMSQDFEAITDKLHSSIMTEYQAIIYSDDDTYTCSLKTQYPTGCVTILSSNGIDCTFECQDPKTQIRYVPNALVRGSKAYIAEELGIDPDVLESNPKSITEINNREQFELYAVDLKEDFTPSWQMRVHLRSTVSVSLPVEQVTQINLTTLNNGYSHALDDLGGYIFSTSRNAFFVKLSYGIESKKYQPDTPIGLMEDPNKFVTIDKSTPNTLRVSQPNPVDFVYQDGVGVYADLTHIKGQIRKVPQVPNAEAQLILREQNTVPCDVVILSAKMSDTPLDLSGVLKPLESDAETTSLVIDIDAPQDEVCVLEIEKSYRRSYDDGDPYTLNPLHYLVGYSSFSEYPKRYVEDVEAYADQTLNLRLYKNMLRMHTAFNNQLVSRVSFKSMEPYVTSLYHKYMDDLFDEEHSWFQSYQKHIDRSNRTLWFSREDGSLLELAIREHPNFDAFQTELAEIRKQKHEEESQRILLKILGLAAMNLEIERTHVDYGDGNKFNFEVSYEPTFKLAKNINLLAVSNLAYIAPQMLGRFEEHAGEHIALNNAPLGAAMDLYMGKRVSSPNEFLADPKQSIFLEAVTRKRLFDQPISTLDSLDSQFKYMGGLRYLYSFIDFYTKPLAILYNVLYYPGSYIRDNPYVKGRRLLAATYSLKPTTWLSVYKEALVVSQRDVSWSHLMSLDSANTEDVERELDLWEDHATVYEFDDLFDEDGTSKFSIFTDKASYRGGKILPRDLQDADIHEKLKRLHNIEESLVYSVSSVRKDLEFNDPFGTTRYNEFSRKLNASINLFARNWTFNLAPLLGEALSKSKFFETYVKGDNPNVSHVANLSQVFNFGVLSPALKKILDNKKVSVGDGEKTKFCEANLEQNAMPYYPMHFALKFFSRVKGSSLGSLPSEDPTSTTSKERLSLGAYMVISNLVGITYQEMTRAIDSEAFGPSVLTSRRNYTLTQCTGFAKPMQDTLISVSQVANGGSIIQDRLNQISKDFNICISYHTSPNYAKICKEDRGDVFTFFDKDMTMFACIYYQKGKLYEIKGNENSYFGSQPFAVKTLTKYRRPSESQVASLMDIQKAQHVVNFLIFAHTYAPSKYGIDFRCSDVVDVLSVLLPAFDTLCKREGYRRLDKLPDTFKSAFCEALVEFLDISEVEDPSSYVSSNYNALDVDQYLPSLYFTEMEHCLETVDNVEEIKTSLEEGNTFFGVLGSTDVTRDLKKYTSSQQTENRLKQNVTFEIDKIINQEPIVQMIQQSVEDEEHYYPTK